MKKQYKIQLPKGKKVTMTNVDFEDGVMTVNVELENSENFHEAIHNEVCGVFGKINNQWKEVLKANGITREKIEEMAKESIKELEKVCPDIWDRMINEYGEAICGKKAKKYEPKDGDFVYVKAGYEHIAIFKKEVGEDMYVYANWNMSFSVSKIIIDNSTPLCRISDIKEIRPVTEREKKILIDKLAEVGKLWNEKEKRIEDIEYIPDDGDIVHILYGDTHEEIAIFYYRLQYDVSLPYYIRVGKEEDLLGHGCAYMLSKEEAGYKDIDESLRICKIMPATKKEKDMMLNHLASIGKRWNPATKRIADVRWRADFEGTYYYIDLDCFNKVRSSYDAQNCTDNIRYHYGNYFKTRESAKKAAEQIREIFKNSKAE